MSDERIEVVCTGRGAHRAVRLGAVQDDGVISGRTHRQIRNGYDELGEHIFGASSGTLAESRRHGREALKPMVSETRNGYDLTCPKCGRNTQIRFDRWAQAWPQLVELRTCELDISRLPF